jgi:hypothetical protein
MFYPVSLVVQYFVSNWSYRIFNSLAISVFVSRSVQVYLSAVILIHFISAAVTLVASPALMVQFSLLYNRVGRAGVLYHFILVFFGLNTLFTTPAIFRQLLNLLSMSISFSQDIKFLKWLKEFTCYMIVLSMTILFLIGSHTLTF